MKEINNMRQNHPDLVVQDLAGMVPSHYVKTVLLMRGVNKWFMVRRYLIQLKHRWKAEIDRLYAEAQTFKEAGKMRKYHRLMGRRAQLIECRQQVRALCHSPRFVDWTGKKVKDIRLPEDFPVLPHKRWFYRHGNHRGKD